MKNSRVVITGIGLVTSLGRTVTEYGDALFAGKSAIGPLTGLDDVDPHFTYGGQIRDFDISAEMPNVDARHMMRFSQFALLAAHRALEDAAIAPDRCDAGRVGTSFSTGIGGLGEIVHNDARRFFTRGARGVSPSTWSEYTPCACTTHVAIHYSFRGPCATHSSGCVSSIDSASWGMEQIQHGKADVMVVGGADTPFFPFNWAAFCRSGILAPTPDDGMNIPRPFSHDHNGIVLVEGGTALILESETHARLRGARIHAEITGLASTEEALPITRLDPTGTAFAVTMQKTLRHAGIRPTDIDWVLAHGTGFPVADCAESQGIETALGDHARCIPVSSIRGAIGQPLASGGGFQIAAGCLAIQRQQVPPTINFSRPAKGCRLDYVPNAARVARIRNVLINTAGVGGTHSGMILSAYSPAG